MVSRRDVLQALTAASIVGVAGCSDDGSGDESETTEEGVGGQTTNGNGDSPMTGPFAFTTTAFDNEGNVPEKYTCSGADVSPPLSMEGVPTDANSLAIVVDDPDAPSGVFTHWLMWNLPPDTTSISENVPSTKTLDDLGDARQGTNDFDDIGYRGPCPPTSHGPHTYRFKLYALEDTLDVDAGAKARAVNEAIDAHLLAKTQFTGEFERG